jgi:hypothetical protein
MFDSRMRLKERCLNARCLSDTVFEYTILKIEGLPEKPMKKPNAPPTQPIKAPLSERDILEIIRFGSKEARIQAIGALREYGMLNFTSYREEEWLVRTPVARKLRELGVPFEWLTEHA